MKKASEYRHHAQECRQLARGAQNPGQRAQLLDMAQTWEYLAKDREVLLREQADLDKYAMRSDERDDPNRDGPNTGAQGPEMIYVRSRAMH